MEIEMLDGVGAEHLAIIRELLAAVEAHDEHAALGEHKWLDLMDGDATGSVAILATEGRTAVGYAHLSRHGSPQRWGLEVVVHPAHRDEDIEVELVERALASCTQRGGGPLHLWVFKPTAVHDELASRLSLVRGRDLLHMRVALPIDADLRLPEGYSLRPFEPGRDEDAWIAVNNEAFADHPEQGDWDRSTLARRMREPWFEPAGFLLAFAGDRLVGSNWMKPDRSASEGEIHVIGVSPAEQGSGLGRTLAVAGLDWAARAGLATGTLYVDAANASAVAMYRSLGFEVDHRDRAYVTEV